MAAERRFHLIAGLPRSGSTLLSAILKQNPALAASVQSPLLEVFKTTLQAMSAAESAMFITDPQRDAVLRSLCEAFYSHLAPHVTVFDSHRAWCSMVQAVDKLFPHTRVICCVRNPAWVLDSLERLVRRNPVRASKMFGHAMGDVFARTEALMTKQLVGPSLRALRHAWCSEEARKLILVRYDSLVKKPSETIAALYRCLGLAPFAHNFSKVQFDSAEFDERLGLPGMHTVDGPVVAQQRSTILPPELFEKYDDEFWEREQGQRLAMVL